VNDEQLTELATGAFRERDRRTGRVLPSPAWRDLDEEGRQALFEHTMVSRALEAALDEGGRSSTVQAVLGRIRGG